MSAAFLVDAAKLTLRERIKSRNTLKGEQLKLINKIRWDLLDGNSSSQASVRQRQTRFVLFRSISLFQDPSSFIYILGNQFDEDIKNIIYIKDDESVNQKESQEEKRNGVTKGKKYQTFPAHLFHKRHKISRTRKQWLSASLSFCFVLLMLFWNLNWMDEKIFASRFFRGSIGNDIDETFYGKAFILVFWYRILLKWSMCVASQIHLKCLNELVRFSLHLKATQKRHKAMLHACSTITQNRKQQKVF